MGTCFLHGQNGGSKLPFRIFYGTTQPSNPKNYDIWIKTSVAVTQVDFVNASWSGAAVGRTIILGATAGGSPSTSNTLTFVVSDKSNGIPTYGRLNLTGCQQVQGSAGNWVNLNAYRYYGGTWVQFSNVFTATINITYPAGSTCTATCGSTTLTAPDTSGTWACKVSASGTWTVTVKNKWSDTVSVTTSGSTVSLDVSKFWLYQPGNTHSNRTGGWKTAAGITGNYTQNSVTFGAAGSNGATLALKTGANASCYMQTSSAVDLSNFTNLVYVFTGEVACNHGYVSRNSSNPNAWENKAASLREDSVGTKTIDISSLSGSYYIYLGHFTSSSFVTAYVKEVYLQ